MISSGRVMRWGYVAVLVILVMLFHAYSSIQFIEGREATVEEVWYELISKPGVLIPFAIQFTLGLALGYFSAKVVKYIVALIGIFIIGVLLNIWQVGGIKEYVSRLGLDWSEVYPLLKSLVTAIGIMTVLPVSLGFLIGVVVAIRK